MLADTHAFLSKQEEDRKGQNSSSLSPGLWLLISVGVGKVHPYHQIESSLLRCKRRDVVFSRDWVGNDTFWVLFGKLKVAVITLRQANSTCGAGGETGGFITVVCLDS